MKKYFKIADEGITEVKDGFFSDLFKSVMTIESSTKDIKEGLERGIDKTQIYNGVMTAVSKLLQTGEHIANVVKSYGRDK